jgi:hypothetical protein
MLFLSRCRLFILDMVLTITYVTWRFSLKKTLMSMGHSSHCKYAIIAGSHHVRPKQIWFPTWLFMLGTACHVVLIFVPYMYPLYVTTSTKWRSQKSEKATKKSKKEQRLLWPPRALPTWPPWSVSYVFICKAKTCLRPKALYCGLVRYFKTDPSSYWDCSSLFWIREDTVPLS